MPFPSTFQVERAGDFPAVFDILAKALNIKVMMNDIPSSYTTQIRIVWPFDKLELHMFKKHETLTDHIVVLGIVGDKEFRIEELADEFPSAKLISQLNLLRE